MSLDKLLSELEEEKAKAIRAEIETSYIGRNVAHEDSELINKVWGRQKGSYETKLKRLAKSIDESLIAPNEIDELGFDKALDATFERLNAKTTELTGKLASVGKPDSEARKQLDEYKSKYEKTLEDYKIIDKSNKDWEEKYQGIQNDFSQYKVNLFVDSKRKEALGKVQFTDTLKGAARDYAINGFLSAVNEKYKIEPDGEELRIIDNTTGQRVHKDNKFLDLSEIYTQEANAAGLLKVSNGNGQDNNEKRIIFDKSSERKPETNSSGLKFKGA